ncbi:Uncharacterised protein [Chlamydia trachomatis]|nr:Uncharacterised protein [Chlamydia trachomatis]
MLEEFGGSYSDRDVFLASGSGQSAGDQYLVFGFHEHARMGHGCSVLVSFHGGIVGKGDYKVCAVVSVKPEAAAKVQGQV